MDYDYYDYDDYDYKPHIRLLPLPIITEQQHNISQKLIQDYFTINDTFYREDEDNTKFYITHTTIMTPALSLRLCRSKVENFYKDYNKIVKYNTTHKDQIFMSITEKPMEFSMFCIDIDLAQDTILTITDTLPELYDDNDIKDYILNTNDTIKRLNPDITNEKLKCIVLTKPPYLKTENGKSRVKHGIHIQYINLFISKEDRKNIQKTSNIGDSIFNNNWLLYGSVKNEYTGTYKVYKIYDYNLIEITLTDFLDTYDIYDTKEQKYKPNKNQLSQVLSIRPFNREITQGFITLNYNTSISYVNDNMNTSEYDLEELNNICNLLTEQQSDSYKIWYIVGQSLYNITNGNEEGLELYKKFSSLSSKYIERETITKYKRLKTYGTFNIDSLIRLSGYIKLKPDIIPEIKLDIKPDIKSKKVKKEKTKYSYTLDKRSVRKWILNEDNRYYIRDTVE